MVVGNKLRNDKDGMAVASGPYNSAKPLSGRVLVLAARTRWHHGLGCGKASCTKGGRQPG